MCIVCVCVWWVRFQSESCIIINQLIPIEHSTVALYTGIITSSIIWNFFVCLKFFELTRLIAFAGTDVVFRMNPRKIHVGHKTSANECIVHLRLVIVFQCVNFYLSNKGLFFVSFFDHFSVIVVVVFSFLNCAMVKKARKHRYSMNPNNNSYVHGFRCYGG